MALTTNGLFSTLHTRDTLLPCLKPLPGNADKKEKSTRNKSNTVTSEIATALDILTGVSRAQPETSGRKLCFFATFLVYAAQYLQQTRSADIADGHIDVEHHFEIRWTSKPS